MSQLSFLSLPPELRLCIELLALPDSVMVTDAACPTPAAYKLLHSNRIIRQDMQWVLERYSPRYRFKDPAQLFQFIKSIDEAHVNRQKRTVEHISFDIFHDANVPTMHWTCYCQGREMHTHDELIEAWAETIPSLPGSLKSVLLDITPAPGWMRKDRASWVPGFIDERLIARKFVSEHETVILQLIQKIHKRFGEDVNVLLGGQLSQKSRPSLDNILTQSATAGIPVTFVGDIFPNPRDLPPLSPEVWNAMPKRRGQEQAWRQKTKRLLNSIRYHDEHDTIALLENIAHFANDEDTNRLHLSKLDSKQRALVHNMAKDMEFSTKSTGDEPDRVLTIEKIDDVNIKF
ncbi:hypothetical protein BT63DRAFT_315509 [Microthyrium microscopicum]|uniref:R3H domain-containing protein n=1 Tax=Microthyrium microscopicum TaxID=703497 RepID=A0A6A6U530_9PEZI|nr:hypothetical protein BT63DRAFT_315509 [Microthyrium microscopicum]